MCGYGLNVANSLAQGRHGRPELLLGQFPAVIAPEPGLRDNGASPPCPDQYVNIRNLPSITTNAVQAKGVIFPLKIPDSSKANHW